MASLTFTLSTVTNMDTGKAEILARYRNTRKVAQRAHTRTFILPEYWDGEKVVINKRREKSTYCPAAAGESDPGRRDTAG